MTNDRRGLLVFLSFILCSAAGPLLAGEAPIMAGHWKLQDSIAGIQKERNCTFTQKGAAFEGSCRDADGPVSVAGRLNGDKLTFQFKVGFAGQELTIKCAGVLKGGQGSGSVEAQPLGIDGDFTLTRSN